MSTKGRRGRASDISGDGGGAGGQTAAERAALKAAEKSTKSAAAMEARRAENAILLIQCMMRRKLARIRVKQKLKETYERVYDPKMCLYFWFNSKTGDSQWRVPFLLKPYDEHDHEAATHIERAARGFLARRVTRRMVMVKYSRFYDAKSDRFYWMNNETKETAWSVSKWLLRMDIPLLPEDQMLYESQKRIKELELVLKAKDEELARVRKKRYEELEPLVIQDKLENAKASTVPRSKHMDDWGLDQLAAWFAEMKLDDYIPTLYTHKIDGQLFVNLLDEDWDDIGIRNRIHIKKLQLIMKSYRLRYKHRQARARILENGGRDDGDDDDDDLSDYQPSELSEVLEKMSDSEEDNLDEEDDDDGNHAPRDELDYSSDEDEEEVDPKALQLSEEERIEREMDDKNMKVETKAKGDGENIPMVGDIVRVRYLCTLSDGQAVSGSKKEMGLDFVEFVLGINQVVKGFDRGLQRMSIGQRAVITCTPEYGYGIAGVYPLVPPNAHLIFDVTLLGFRPRPVWIKTLIQEPGFSEKPYIDKLEGNALDRAIGASGALQGGQATSYDDASIGSGSAADSSMHSEHASNSSMLIDAGGRIVKKPGQVIQTVVRADPDNMP